MRIGLVSMKQGFNRTTNVRRVCYFKLPYYFALDNYTAYLCTHLIAGFVKTLDNGTLTMVRPSDPDQYNALLELKSCNQDLKIIVTTGINNYNNSGSRNFSVLVNTTEGRRQFVDGALTFVRKNGFDGLDLDWEYPGHPKNTNDTNDATGDKKNFCLLLEELHNAFTNKSDPQHRGVDLILSVALSASRDNIDRGYNISCISEYADLINLMCYNYHLYQPNRNYTRHNSPLFINEEELSSPRIKEKDKELFNTSYVNWTVPYLMSLNLNASKLNVGIPVFGRTFNLTNSSDHDFLAPASGPGPGPSKGLMEYFWVCQFVNDSNTTTKYDNKSVAPYAYNETVWVAYNEEKAIRAKVNWTVSNGYGGVMTYALTFDDVNDTCKGGRYPVHSLIRDLLLNASIDSVYL
ncbi:chitinase-3-like protein 1 [Haemaphysalis longicornis]